MIAGSLQSLLDSWPWLVVSLGLGAAFGSLWRRRRLPLEPLWQALGRSPADPAATPAAAWTAVVEQVQLQRDSLRRSQEIQLRGLATEEQAAITSAVLAQLPDGVIAVDADERVLFANATARRVLQIGDRTQATLAQLEAPFEIVEGVRAVLAADLARTVKSSRIEWKADDRRYVYLIRAIAEVAVTKTKRAQVVLLEDWTAEERAARAKSEFIYGVSHELKTPLTAIQASLELASEGGPALSTEDRDKLIDVSYQESVRLSQMVAELLDLARVEAGITEFKHETVDMREVLQSLQALHRPIADRKSITLKWDISDYLADFPGDARLLRQAMVNIVGNALKYTKDGGDVSLTARLEGHELVIRVRDTGIGIAPEDQARVFEKFFRGQRATQSSIQGTGLGLPMARYIIERHRGRIELSSQPGVGTEFRVYLPAVSSETDADATPTLVAVDSARE